MVTKEAISCSLVTALLTHDHCPHKGLLAEMRGSLRVQGSLLLTPTAALSAPKEGSWVMGIKWGVPPASAMVCHQDSGEVWENALCSAVRTSCRITQPEA